MNWFKEIFEALSMYVYSCLYIIMVVGLWYVIFTVVPYILTLFPYGG